MKKNPVNPVERRASSKIEMRAATAETPGALVGYAAVFNSPSQDLGGFIEQIAPGAFASSLASAADILALCQHDHSQILARRAAGNLTLVEDDTGLLVTVTLAATSRAADLVADIAAGNIRGMSFAFRVIAEDWILGVAGAPDTRVLREVELVEVSAVTDPAYLATEIEVAQRNRPAPELSAAQKPSDSDAAAAREQYQRLHDLHVRLLSMSCG